MHWRTFGLPFAVYDVDYILTFCLMNDGGCSPTSLFPFCERIIQSFMHDALISKMS